MSTSNVEGEKVGVINRAFGYLYKVHLAGQRVKAWNYRVYRVLKLSLIGAVAALFVMSAFR